MTAPMQSGHQILSDGSLPDFRALPLPLAVVCHDAGAANLIIGWLKAKPRVEMRAHMGGPAQALWEAAFPDVPIRPLSATVADAGMLLSGTGWAGMLEHEARIVARGCRIPVVAAVDHWVNYRQRFVRDGAEVLPDEIWVSDPYAQTEARRCFPGLVIRQFANVYLQAQVDQIAALDARPRTSQGHVLYALEPIRLLWQTADPRAGEFQALDYFLSKLNALHLASDAEIRLRPHPSDAQGKYDRWIASHSHYNVSLAPEETIAEAIAWADIVAGCESFVLIIGVAAGRKVVSTLPPWANALRLPHGGIIRLRDL